MQANHTQDENADALLSEVDAAELLGLSTRTLQSWRMQETGPDYVRAGRAIRYRRRDLLAWIDANTIRSAPLKNQADAR
jgi:predicted DNA-binding transcriptional regulator AlpA